MHNQYNGLRDSVLGRLYYAEEEEDESEATSMADVDRFLANNENDVSGAGVTNVSFQTGAAD